MPSYRSRVVSLSCRSATQVVAYFMNATFPASGSIQSDRAISVCLSASHPADSFRVSNVSGAGRKTPSGLG
jgi:hypothetical protein